MGGRWRVVTNRKADGLLQQGCKVDELRVEGGGSRGAGTLCGAAACAYIGPIASTKSGGSAFSGSTAPQAYTPTAAGRQAAAAATHRCGIDRDCVQNSAGQVCGQGCPAGPSSRQVSVAARGAVGKYRELMETRASKTKSKPGAGRCMPAYRQRGGPPYNQQKEDTLRPWQWECCG